VLRGGAARAKLSLAERVFICEEETCGNVMDRDLNAALNLAHMAQRGVNATALASAHVADTETETQNARRGQVSLGRAEHSPSKREVSTETSQGCEALALAPHARGGSDSLL
jgi:putative transposase